LYVSRHFSTAVGCLLSLSSLTAVAADTAAYPARPVRMIVPFAPGGASDTAGRIIQPAMARLLAEQVVDVPGSLVTHPSLPAKNVKALIDHMKANPGKLNYGAPADFVAFVTNETGRFGKMIKDANLETQ